MKRLNVKLLAIVAIVFVVLTGGVVVVHGIQMRRNIDSLLKRAETAKENDDLRNALVLYQRYRSYRPNDLERGAVFASLLADKARITFLSPDYGAAHAAMIQVLSGMEQRPELKSEMLDLQNKLIDLNIAFREFGQARDDLKKLKDKGQSDPASDLKLAQCYINTVEYGKARTLLESLVGYQTDIKAFNAEKATAPHEIDAYSTLAILLREKMRDEDAPDRILVADKVIDQMVAVNPESARGFLSQAEYLAKYQSRDNAKPAVEKALQLAPEDDEVLVHAAELALNSNDLDSAETYSKRGIDKYPKDWRFYQLWTQVAEAQKKPEEARKRLEAGLEAVPANIFLLNLSFDQQIRARDFKGAEVTLKKLTFARLRPEYRDYAEGRLLVAEGKMPEASQLLEQLQPRAAKIPALARLVDVLLVQCYATLNQPDRLLVAAKRIANTPEGQMGIAIAEQQLGQTGKTYQRYSALLKALEQNKQAANVPQLLIPMYNLQFSEQLRKPKGERDWKEVEASLAKLREQETVKEPAGTLMYVNLLAAKDETQQARHELAELLKKYPSDVGVLVRAIQFALQEKDVNLATRIINFAPAEVRHHPLLIAGLIETTLMGGKKPDEVKVLLGEIAKEAEKLPPADRTQVDINLGMAYLRIGDNASAKQYWDHATQLDPHNANIRLMQFNLARVTGDLDKLRELQTWFEKEPNTDPAQVKLLQASVLVGTVRQAQRAQITNSTQATIVLDATDKKNLETAKSLLRDVENMRPNWIEQPKLMADINILEGRHDDAIEQLRKATTVGQPTPEVIKQLAMLLHLRNRNPEAEDVLVSNQSLVLGDPEIDRLMASIYVANGKPQAALERIQSRFKSDSTDVNEHLLQGQMLYGADKLEEAEAAFRKVTELAPERPEGWFELVRVLVKDKKNEEARRTAQAAQTKLPEERRGLVLAQSYEMIGDTAQAEKAYQSAVAAAPNSLSPQQQIAAFYARTGHIDQAKQYLNKIMASAPQTQVDKECYAWARRMTAELLASDGKYSQFLQAMEMLSPTDGKATAEDLYLRIALLFRRSDPNSSRQALRLLEDLKKIRPLTSGERLNLAQLYERVGDWSGARAEMQSLLADPKPDPNVYITYIKMQLRRGTPGAADEASNWMRSLQSSLEASGIKTTHDIAFLAARVASMQGRGPQAAAIMITTLISTQRPLPDDAWPTVALLVGSGDSPGYLEQLGQSEAAEKLLRENLGSESKKNMLLAGLLARRGKIDQALDLIDQIRPALGVTGALQLGVTALSQNVVPPKPEQIQRVEKWFERGLREEPDSLAVQMKLADLHSVERNWPEVEKVYRSVLKRPDLPDDVRAGVLNNMAFIIAMQGKDKDEAMRYITEAVNIYGPQTDMLDTRGIVHLSRNEVEQAVADLTDSVITSDPQPIKFVHLAMAQTKAGDLPAARRSLERAKELKFNTDDLSPLEKSQFQVMVKQLGVTI